MNPDILAGIVKRVYNNFNMSSFSNRLKIQKFTYLMQKSGLYIGYDFSLYMRGPYCTELTKDAFQVDDFSTSPPIRFSNNEMEMKFKSFLDFFRPHKDDTEWLEIASSILIFKEMYPSLGKSEIQEKVRNKNEFLTQKAPEIAAVWEDLERGGFL